MKSSTSVILFFVINFIGFFVHEYGHALAGVLLGADVMSFEFGFLVFSVQIINYDIVFKPLILMAGGFLQSAFLLIGPVFVPTFELEFKFMVFFFMIYGLVESGLIL